MTNTSLQLPKTTTARLVQFQRQVRRIKLAEATLAAVFGLVLSYVIVFVLDRFFDTPAILRGGLLLLGSIGLGVIFPLMCHRWVWKTRQMEQVARLLKHKFPGLGDQLLGVVELARDPEQAGHSLALTKAAIAHVDGLVRDRDFSSAVPHPRHQIWSLTTAVPMTLALVFLLVVPAAGLNAFQRWLAPWSHIDRYTFAQIEDLPANIIVPHGEDFALNTSLKKETAWSPPTGSATINHIRTEQAALHDSQYDFPIPGQTTAASIDLRIGDVRKTITIQPEPRPELIGLQATIVLPSYLQRTNPLIKDARSGSLSVVKGATAQIHADISRELTTGTVTLKAQAQNAVASDLPDENRSSASAAQVPHRSTATGQATATRIQDSVIASSAVSIEESLLMDISWRDHLGLTSQQPFRLKLNMIEDLPPAISCQQQEPQQVILSTDVITFELSAADDFGVKQMGLSWQGMLDAQESPETGYQVQAGQKVAAGGGADREKVQATVTFCADSDGVVPQLLELRAWAEDFYPDRERIYSPSYVLHVMRPSEHAIWISSQLRRWASQAEDVYEEEMRLHATNRELRSAGIHQLGQPDLQQTVAQQIAAERANAARLGNITSQGRALIQQAMRNQEMQAQHLETWAAALLNLEKMSQQQMPSVADLLNSAAAASIKAAAAEASSQQQNDLSKQSPTVGNNRSTMQGQGSKDGQANTNEDDAEDKNQQQAPRIEDVESGFNQPNSEDPEEKTEDAADGKKKKSGPGRLTLPETVLQGGPKAPPSGKKPLPQQEAEEDLEEAVSIQESLLLEFERIRDDLQSIMDELENSTFVKRLKAASRRQLEIAYDLNRSLANSFGIDYRQLDDRRSGLLNTIAQRERDQSQALWNIQSDMEAYMTRMPDPASLRIIDEMKDMTAVRKIEHIAERVQENMTGEAISRAEYWADVLDRWAEELVPVPAENEGDKSKDQSKAQGSLPPAIVLEIMRVLEGEIDLREETRSLEQAREAIVIDDYSAKALQQANTQKSLVERTVQVMNDIRALPEGGEAFENELAILSEARDAMTDAQTILTIPNTGPDVIAAETHAIECLLQAKRSQPNDSSGKATGAQAGFGSDGNTEQAALALMGSSADTKAKIQQRGVNQATGNAENALPEEFRDGLDAFFNAVEQGQQ